MKPFRARCEVASYEGRVLLDPARGGSTEQDPPCASVISQRRFRMRTLLVVSAIVAAALMLRAQDIGPGGGLGGGGRRKPVPTGAVPRLPDGSVDLSGAWLGGGPVQDMEQQGHFKPGEIPLLSWAKQLMDSRKPEDDPHAHCMPMGIPRVAGPYPWRFIQY